MPWFLEGSGRANGSGSKHVKFLGAFPLWITPRSLRKGCTHRQIGQPRFSILGLGSAYGFCTWNHKAKVSSKRSSWGFWGMFEAMCSGFVSQGFHVEIYIKEQQQNSWCFFLEDRRTRTEHWNWIPQTLQESSLSHAHYCIPGANSCPLLVPEPFGSDSFPVGRYFWKGLKPPTRWCWHSQTSS